jgi:hypothetical protein
MNDSAVIELLDRINALSTSVHSLEMEFLDERDRRSKGQVELMKRVSALEENTNA